MGVGAASLPRFSPSICVIPLETSWCVIPFVSLTQLWIRPMVHGKASVMAEFWVKLHLGTDDDGLARLGRIARGTCPITMGLVPWG